MTGERGQVQPEVATRASPVAWIMLSLAEFFFLVIANAFLFQANIVWHASKTYDAAVGKTYVLHDHGKVSWVRPHDFMLYGQAVRVGMGGLFLSILVMLIFIRAPTLRYLEKQRTHQIAPLVLLIASVLFWLRVHV